jgi:hypothetical protein
MRISQISTWEEGEDAVSLALGGVGSETRENRKEPKQKNLFQGLAS